MIKTNTHNHGDSATPPHHDLKLYGIAIGAAPSKENRFLIKGTCTPIAVSTHDFDNFEILRSHCLDFQFDYRDIHQIMDCFAHIAEKIDYVVSQQEKELADRGLPYTKISLYVGQDGRRPIKYLAFGELYTSLFGKQKFTRNMEESVLTALMKDREQFVDPPASSDTIDQPLDSFFSHDNPQDFYSVLKHKAALKAMGTLNDYLLNTMDRISRVVEKAHSARFQFLAQHAGDYRPFSEACQKLSKLLPKCSLKWGSYTRNISPYPLTESPLDREIISLHATFTEGSAHARHRLIDLARLIGEETGEILRDGNGSAMTMPNPNGYSKDTTMQVNFPSHGAFLYWDQAFRSAFYEGYKSTYNGAYNQCIKLPLDPPNPFFTDPCANRIRDLIEVALGKRAPGMIREDSLWNQKITSATRRFMADREPTRPVPTQASLSDTKLRNR